MPRKLLEVTAVYASQQFRFKNATGDVIVGEASIQNGDGRPQRIAVKGPVDNDDEPASGVTYRWYGYWSDYTNRRTGETERQFCFSTYVRATPHGRTGVVRYLERAPHVGRVIAGRLWDVFGEKCVEVLRTDPGQAAAKIDRLSLAGAEEAGKWLIEQQALENCTIELIDLLDGRGLPKSVAKQAVKQYGNLAAAIVRSNPYLLMRFRGCGFKRADALYLDLGKPPAKLKRQSLCAWHSIASNTSGDTWHYVGVVEQGLKGSIAGADVRLEDALRLAVRSGMLATTWTDGRDGVPAWDGSICWLAEQKKARNELRIAEFLAEATGE
jgi:hypothetical protein